MSGERNLVTAGVAIIDADGQRDANHAAAADDLAIERIEDANWQSGLGLGGASPSDFKFVTPCPRRLGTLAFLPERLVEALTGGDAGKVRVNPATLRAMSFGLMSVDPSLSNQGQTAIAVRMLDAIKSAQFPSNTFGGAVTYLVYLTVSRQVNATGARRVKNLTTKQVTTQTVNLTDAPAVTCTVLPNAGLADLPADGANAWNFAIALVSIPNPYTAGTAITQSWITPVWRRGGVAAGAVRRMVTTTPNPAAVAFSYETAYLSAFRYMRLATKQTRCFLIALSGADGFGILDQAIDWRRRLVRVSVCRPANHGGGTPYPAVDSVVSPGSSLSADSGLQFTGDGVAFWSCDSGKLLFYTGNGAGGTPVNGALYLQTATATAGSYVIEVEYGDRLDE